jgi:entry exclusion lipoprotein TrbK
MSELTVVLLLSFLLGACAKEECTQAHRENCSAEELQKMKQKEQEKALRKADPSKLLN